jgi:hypothetical protein
MKTKINYTLFAAYLFFGQWIFWLVIWLLAKIRIWRVLFVIYPHNHMEYQHVMPDWKWVKKYMSGKPIPAGIIRQGCRPTGIYFYISNRMKSLRKKKNRHIAKKIERRMRRALQITGAQSCGFAGQLGIIMEKRHDISMGHLFHSSMQGNIFSLSLAIDHAKRSKKHEDSDN